MPPKPQPPPGQGKEALSVKENSNFKGVLQAYERKQYKRGIKLADGILRKHKEHGETLCMKGLILNALKRTEEGEELIRTGLRKDLRSNICWHVYGLFHRSQGNYAEAVKAYGQALRFDPDNGRVLHDQAQLQIQVRDVKGFAESQRRLLALRGSNKLAWLGFPVGHHLIGNTDLALEVLSQYEATVDAVAASTASSSSSANSAGEGAYTPTYETNELVLYKARILEEDGQYDRALAEISTGWHKILDKPRALERRASLLTHLGRFAQALPLWEDLLTQVNPETHNYHRGLQACLLERADAVPMLHRGSAGSNNVLATLSNSVYDAHNAAKGSFIARGCELPVQHGSITPAQVDALLATYMRLAKAFPRAAAHRRIPLLFLPADHEEFLPRLEAYIVRSIRKCVYSVAQDIKVFYRDSAKAEVLKGLLIDTFLARAKETYARVKEAGRAASPAAAKDHGAETETVGKDPNETVWAFFLAASHYQHLQHYDRALELIDMALEHTPTVVEFYLTRGRILRKLGRIEEAADALVVGRKLDLADRYINTKCTKYLFRAGRQDEANETATMFARHEQGDALLYLVDLQTMWFEYEAAMSYERSDKISMALKRYGNILKHFGDVKEDQFDFHQYCLRRATMRTYVDFLHWEDNLYKHPYYVNAALGMARCWLRLHLEPELRRQGSEHAYTDAELAKMSSTERKRAKRRMQKAKKEQAASEEKTAAANKGAGKGKRVDEDPQGLSYLKEEEPLEKAIELLRQLDESAPDTPHIHAVAAHVAALRKRPLQALKHAYKLKQQLESLEPSKVQKAGLLSRQAVDAALQAVNAFVKEAAANAETDESVRAFLKAQTGVVDEAAAALERLSLQ